MTVTLKTLCCVLAIALVNVTPTFLNAQDVSAKQAELSADDPGRFTTEIPPDAELLGRSVVGRGGGSTRSRACELARADADRQCANRLCIACQSFVGDCDCACLVGDLQCTCRITGEACDETAADASCQPR